MKNERRISEKIPSGDTIVLSLRVLGYLTETGEWAAHCLETDLVGYGGKFEEALKHLEELTEMQINFSVFKNQPALLDRPAPPHIFEMYNQLFRIMLEHYNQKRTSVRDLLGGKHMIACVPLPERPLKGPRISFVPEKALQVS